MSTPSSTFYLLPSKSPPKVAIVHDWLVGGGAELVVEQLHKLYPEAPIYTSYCTHEWRRRLDGKVVTGWLQYLGWVRKFIPVLRIWWFTRLNLERFDLVISSSGAEAKGIKYGRQKTEGGRWQHKPGPIHINYCHAPTHYYWSRYNQYLKHPGFGPLDWLARFGLRVLVGPLRVWDYKAAQRPDYLIANSTHIQAEIKKYYNRQSAVIHPPVYFARFQKPANRHQARRGFVVAGRQTPYKRFDLAVAACTRLNLPLTVIGDGPEHHKLRRLGGKSVTFLGRVSDEVLEEEFARAEALLFPGLDDFGITAVEALAAGTPIIAYQAGGALDYVRPDVTGQFFAKQTVASLLQTLRQFQTGRINPKDCRWQAQQFSAEKFSRNMQAFVQKVLSEPKGRNSVTG